LIKPASRLRLPLYSGPNWVCCSPDNGSSSSLRNVVWFSTYTK
jgi:hypothetical protein